MNFIRDKKIAEILDKISFCSNFFYYYNGN